MQVEGQRGTSLLVLPATGARVSNTYAICPPQGDNPEKSGLIPRGTPVGHPTGVKRKRFRRRMGMRRISLLAG